METVETLLSQLSQSVIDGDRGRAIDLTKRLIDDGVDARIILEKGLMPGMNVVGERFRENIIFVPEVLVSARAMKSSLSLIEPILSKSNIKPVATFVIGTVKGDIHDIGKNIVGMMMRGAGFSVIDIGVDCDVDKFLSAVREYGADILGMSALLTTTMGYMKVVIGRIRREISSDKLKIIVGGAPVTRAFADKIGADGYAENAAEAVQMAKELLKIN